MAEVAVQVNPPSRDTSYVSVDPDSWPATIRSKLPSWVMRSLVLLPPSVKLLNDRLPGVGAVVSTVTLTGWLVLAPPATSVVTTRNW